MMVKTISPAYSLEGWNWKPFLLGFKKPAIVLVVAGLTALLKYPEANSVVLALGGVSVIAERLWALAEFYIKQIKK